MKYLETYLKTIEGRGNKQLADSIRKTVDNIAPRNFLFVSMEWGFFLEMCSLEKRGRCLA